MKRESLETASPRPEPVKKKRPRLDTALKKPIPIEEFKGLDKRKDLPVKSFAPYGTARLNVFYPVNKNKIDGRLEKVTKELDDWGCFTYHGERLRVYDLETLIAINAIMMKRNSWNLTIKPEDVCKILKTKPKKDQVEARRRSIFRLGSAVFQRYLPKGYRHSIIGTILVLFAENTDDGKFALSIHPFFYRELLNNNFTFIDIPLLMSLRGGVTKMAYVFYAAQKKDGYIKLRTLLCDICNLPGNTSNSVLRKKAKKIHDELVAKEFLAEYRIHMDGVTPKRAPKKLTGKKPLSFFHNDGSHESKEVKDPNPEITKYLMEFHAHLTRPVEYNDQEKGQFAQAARKFKDAIERGDGKGVVADVYDEAKGELQPVHIQYIQTFFQALRWKFKKNLDLRPGTWCANKIWESVWFSFLESNRPTEVDEDSCKTHTHEEDYYFYKPDSERNDDYDPSDEHPD